MTRPFFLLLWMSALCQQPLPAQGATPPQATPPQSGIDRPIVVVPATSDEVTTKVSLRGLEEAPQSTDIEAGLLSSAQRPSLLVHPSVTVLSASAVPGKPGEFLTELRIQGLVAFGESSTPLLSKGRQIDSLRFSRPGLVAKPVGDEPFSVREGSDLLVVLENPSAFEYKSVRARLRFDSKDVCTFDAETFGGAPRASGSAHPPCDVYANWTAFDIPKYAQVTLRANPARDWFRDAATGFFRSSKQKGSLTLRFQAAANSPIHEQNLPLEVQFEPGNWSLLRSLSKVAALLLVGAGISLLLRVSVPNIKRRRQLRDQLREAAKQTASISNEVDSNLRVLLRVERIALDEIRVAVWSFGPGYADYARRVEQGLPTLNRRIDAVRRLDAALIRSRLLEEQGVAPTRLGQIDSLVAAISATLMQDQLSDEDWVSVSQRLETVQKALREPTQTEKEAFEAMLAARWKSLSEHFGVEDNGALKVPKQLHGMEASFPDSSLLPRKGEDGSKWVQSVGPVRADLQLSALELVWEYQFLAPTDEADSAWTGAKKSLNHLLATPTIDNLREAKSILRQLAEGVTEDDIVTALQEGNATIVMDPAIPRPNQKIRFFVRFRVVHLNTSAARELVDCRWDFLDMHLAGYQKAARRLRDVPRLFSRQQQVQRALESERLKGTSLSEHGWYVHHYFEKDVAQSEISISFYDSEGKLLDLGLPKDADAGHWSRLTEPLEPSRRPTDKWGRAWLELFQLAAALFVPLATLASTTLSGGSSGRWWELIAIGFGSDTIKSILVGRQDSVTST